METTFVSEPVATAIGAAPNTQMANILAGGGQLGVGINAPMLDAATPAVFTPTVVVVLKTPDMYAANPHMQHLLKTLIECHARSITGIDFGYTVDSEGGPLGHDGQTFDVPTKSKRSRPNPSITFNELTGNVVWNVFNKWVTDIQHPDSNFSTVNGAIPRNAATYSMVWIAIQYDPGGDPNNILGAAVYQNVWPTDIGQFGFERNIGTSRAIERTITFNAHVMHNQTTTLLGRLIAKRLKLATVDFNRRLAQVSNIADGLGATGLEREVMSALATS